MFILFSFALDYTVNALFYNDDKMHNIYEDEGKYNIFSQITNIIYSTLFSTVINSLLEYLSLSEDIIIKVKKDGDEKNKIKKCMKIKFILFFILDFIFLLFFWYYISCFCVVYKNTQIYLIKDILLALLLSLLYPFVLGLIPGIFRIPSLRADKQNKRCVYKFSLFIEKVDIIFLLIPILLLDHDLLSNIIRIFS